ncbi:AraC family transcriptional regulator [Labilibaculum sp.]|uniref:AraC family transcriptional regulator n=1 Tax=Labilibaculum sp. TaxID=2060723 RepID=UPI002AA65401|nr:AraC family transcriptional regulator [Labilibaculum sp.]
MLTIKTYKAELFPDLIERIWVAENKETEVELMIPPNQYVNLIFTLNNSTYKRDEISIEVSQIEGISTKNTVLVYPAGTKIIGVRFFAFGLYPFIQIQGKRLIDRSIYYPLETKGIKDILNCSISDSDTVLIDKVCELLRDLYCEKSCDAVFQIMDFYKQFRWNDEACFIEDYCKRTGTNYTTLNRSFTQIVGITPKKFERLIKFRKSLCSLIDSKDNLTSIGANSGYFDQAHFIREFKMFVNQTPSDYQALIKLADRESKIINYNFKLF